MAAKGDVYRDWCILHNEGVVSFYRQTAYCVMRMMQWEWQGLQLIARWDDSRIWGYFADETHRQLTTSFPSFSDAFVFHNILYYH